MQGTIKLSPIITYNPSTQELDIHQISQTLQYKHIKLISTIEVKAKDYRIFGSRFQHSFHQQNHGIYISHPVKFGDVGTQDQRQDQRDYFAYLVLPANEGRVAEKIQDLLAAIALMLSNVCVFDISSKYLRLSKNVENRPEKINYVIMSSHSNGSELYRANISNQNNKMQITTKLQSQEKILTEQLTRNIKTKYLIQQIHKIIKNELKDIILLKNYISFQQVQFKILGQVRICEYLDQVSKEFRQTWFFDEKISLFQMANIQNCIDKFVSAEFGNSDHASILLYCKSLMKQQIRMKNMQLNEKFIFNLKEEYFNEIISQNQLVIKIQLCEKILEQYGIQLYNLPILFSESSKKLQKDHNSKQLSELVQKYNQIQELEQNLILCEKKILKYEQALGVYEAKNFDFKELNNQYIEKCGQLERQRNSTRKYKLQIECMLLEMQRKNSIEQTLNKLIKQSEHNKENLTRSLLQSQMEIKNKEKYIIELQNRNQQFLTKIKNHQNLQGQAWKCIEETQSAHDQLRRYKELLQKLEDHFEVFKKKQIQKFNYILKKNSEQYFKLKKELQSKNLILQQYQNKIDKLGGELEEQKSRLKFCQEQIWINKNYKNTNLNSSSVKKNFESLSNRQQYTKQESTCKNFIVV